jgi:hypothetical protein
MTTARARRGMGAVALIALAVGVGGCGGGETSSTTTPTEARGGGGGSGTATGASTTAGNGGEKARSRPTSPAGCAKRWNRGGVDPDLNHVLIPIVKAVGPFRAEIGLSTGDPEVIPPDICVVIVHATRVEGTKGLRYTTTQSSARDTFVQSPVSNARILLGGGPLAPATLERDGSLRLRP